MEGEVISGPIGMRHFDAKYFEGQRSSEGSSINSSANIADTAVSTPNLAATSGNTSAEVITINEPLDIVVPKTQEERSIATIPENTEQKEVGIPAAIIGAISAPGATSGGVLAPGATSGAASAPGTQGARILAGRAMTLGDNLVKVATGASRATTVGAATATGEGVGALGLSGIGAAVIGTASFFAWIVYAMVEGGKYREHSLTDYLPIPKHPSVPDLNDPKYAPMLLPGSMHGPDEGFLLNDYTVPRDWQNQPVFDSLLDVRLPDDLVDATDSRQFRHALKDLREELKSHPKLKRNFTLKQLKEIQSKKASKRGTLPSLVWHHHPYDVTVLQLVSRPIHQKNPHIGSTALTGRLRKGRLKK